MTYDQAMDMLCGSVDLTAGVRDKIAKSIDDEHNRLIGINTRNRTKYTDLKSKAIQYRKDMGIYKSRWEAEKKKIKPSREDRNMQDLMNALRGQKR